MDRRRLSELFEQALDVDADDRPTWLAKACGDDHALRDEVMRLLRADAKAVGFLESPPGLVADAAAAGAEASAPPQQFGPYRVLRAIGVGGMGEVWLAARCDGAFEQRVAIKQVAYPTPGLLHRFRQERQILARLEHPHIARLIDGGVDANGAPYLVMEYVDGVPITDYVRREALDLAARLRLFLRVCVAVQYAHQNLIVHRDLKPSNIFVTGDGVPKLLDFGIAKVLATTDVDAATQTIGRMLTPDYAAPEQFSGGAITTAIDVYALGVVLYELLAGTRPARDARLSASAVEPLAPSCATTQPADAAGTVNRRALRGDLDRIALTALAPDPRRRYATADALGADIRRYLDGRPIAARGDAVWYRLVKFGKRNRYALSAAAIVFAVGIAATVISMRQATLAREHAQRAESVRRFLVGVFEQAHPDQNKGQPITAQQLLEKGELQLSGQAAQTPAIRTDLTALIGSLYWNVGDGVRAERLLRDAVAASEDSRVPPEVRARSLLALARLESEKHLYDAAQTHAAQALDAAQKAGGAGLEELDGARHLGASLLVWRGDPERAEEQLRTLLAEDRARHGDRSQAVVDDLILLGRALDMRSRYDDSTAALREAVATARALHGDRHSAVAGALDIYGLMLGHRGDYVGAERAMRENLAISEALYGPDHSRSVTARSKLLLLSERNGRLADALRTRLAMLDAALVNADERPDQLAYAWNFVGADYRGLGRLEESAAAYRAGLDAWKRVHASDNSLDVADNLFGLGVTLELLGDYAGAEDALRRAIAIEQPQLPPSSHWLNRDRATLANVLRLQRRYAEARQEAAAAVAALDPSPQTADPTVAVIHARLSEAQLDAGDATAARATADAAVTMARRVLPRDNWQLGTTLFALARAELALGHATNAESLLREALAVRSPPHPANDPRVLEVQVALVAALAANDSVDEAAALRAQIEPLLAASASPVLIGLRAQLASLP